MDEKPRHFEEKRANARTWAKLKIYTRPLLGAEPAALLPTLGSKNPKIPQPAVEVPILNPGY